MSFSLDTRVLTGDRSAVITVRAKGVGAVVGDTSYSLARELSVEADHSGHRCPHHRDHHQQYLQKVRMLIMLIGHLLSMLSACNALETLEYIFQLVYEYE